MDSPLCFLPQMASDKAIKTRQSILDAAKAIIIEEGIGALTMERAATKAGISKGACMYHFKSKRALQAALVEEYAAHLSSELARHEALFDGPPEETLVPGFIEWFRSFDHDNHGWSTVGLAIHSNFVHAPCKTLVRETACSNCGLTRRCSNTSARGHHGYRGLLLFA